MKSVTSVLLMCDMIKTSANEEVYDLNESCKNARRTL